MPFTTVGSSWAMFHLRTCCGHAPHNHESCCSIATGCAMRANALCSLNPTRSTGWIRTRRLALSPTLTAMDTNWPLLCCVC